MGHELLIYSSWNSEVEIKRQISCWESKRLVSIQILSKNWNFKSIYKLISTSEQQEVRIIVDNVLQNDKITVIKKGSPEKWVMR